MIETGIKSAISGLEAISLNTNGQVFWNLSPAELIEQSLKNGEGNLADSGALFCDTGKFTGRSPKDKYIVKDTITENLVWWNEPNYPTTSEVFAGLKKKITDFLKDKNLYVRDALVCASEEFKMKVRVINTHSYHNLFVHNMFLRPSAEEVASFSPEWTVIHAPDFSCQSSGRWGEESQLRNP
jgi:phosphoenolpyruvate carboxykinase (ATP)